MVKMIIIITLVEIMINPNGIIVKNPKSISFVHVSGEKMRGKTNRLKNGNRMDVIIPAIPHEVTQRSFVITPVATTPIASNHAIVKR